MNQSNLEHYFSQLNLPQKNSHKGQNGKLLLIGGSELFHAASKWSLDVASKIVDMVFYSSVLENNELVKKAKSEFWNGIVIDRQNLEDYIEESDCVLIGPGMERNEETADLVNKLLQKYPDKKCVVDAGALQMVDPHLLNSNHIITPHYQELLLLSDPGSDSKYAFGDFLPKVTDIADPIIMVNLSSAKTISQALGGATVLIKGVIDFVGNTSTSVAVPGGNEGMTKGGTGDVLAGLVAALYCTNTAFTSAVVASSVNKQAGDELYKTVGPFFNASDLVEQVPKTLWYNLSQYEH